MTALFSCHQSSLKMLVPKRVSALSSISFVLLLLFTVALAPAPALAKTGHDTWESGVQPSKPLHLGKANFDAALADPANSFWLLKFYAPWCGHCKRLSPILDQIAPQLKGKMSIAKIDCTTERKLCDQYKVRGYPTMKFAWDGLVQDYPGGRSAKDFLAFAHKMRRPALGTVTSITQAMEYAETQSDNGVVFVAFHPELKSLAVATTDDDVDKIADKTLWTQVFNSVARKHRLTTDFMILTPNDDTVQSDQGVDPQVQRAMGGGDLSVPFICRLEQYVDVRCFEAKGAITETAISIDELNDYVQANKVATVSQLGPNNFAAITRNPVHPRPVVIGAVKSSAEEDVAVMKQHLIAAATHDEYRDTYYFGYIDGGHFYKFLDQFGIARDEMPQVFVLDFQKDLYWQNATYSLPQTMQFLNHVRDGTIESKPTKGASKGIQKVLDKFVDLLVENRPWSIMIVVLVCVMLAVIFAAIVSPGEPIKPLPHLQKQKERQAKADKGDGPSTAMPKVGADGTKTTKASSESIATAETEKASNNKKEE